MNPRILLKRVGFILLSVFASFVVFLLALLLNL